MSNYSNDKTEQQLAEIFKALSNPHRLRIFTRLASCCPPGTVCALDAEMASCCVSDLGAELDIAPSTLSHHIKELSRAGLLRLERRGKYIDCRVDPETVEMLRQFFNGGQPSSNCCG